MTKNSIISGSVSFLIHEHVWFPVLEDPLLTSVRLDDIQLSGFILPQAGMHYIACSRLLTSSGGDLRKSRHRNPQSKRDQSSVPAEYDNS